MDCYSKFFAHKKSTLKNSLYSSKKIPQEMSVIKFAGRDLNFMICYGLFNLCSTFEEITDNSAVSVICIKNIESRKESLRKKRFIFIAQDKMSSFIYLAMW